MPFCIILLILFFLGAGNFFLAFLGWKGLTLSCPPEIVAYEGQN
jgi:hypothetical protein